MPIRHPQRHSLLTTLYRVAGSTTPSLPAFTSVVAAYGLHGYNPVGYPAGLAVSSNEQDDVNFTEVAPYPSLTDGGVSNFAPPFLVNLWADQNAGANNLTASGAARPTLLVTTPVIISGAGTSAANGQYNFSGLSSGFAYYNLAGQPASTTNSAIVSDGTTYSITNGAGAVIYSGDAASESFPWLSATWTRVAPGVNPPPTVTPGTQTGELQFTGSTPTGLTGANPLYSGGSATGTIYIPFKPASLAETSVLLETGDGAAGSARRISVRMVAGVLTASCFDATAVVALANTKIKTISDTNWHIATVRFDTSLSAANQVQLLVDNSATGVTAPISTDLTGLLLGNGVPNFGYRNGGASAGFTGSATDCLAFSAAHNGTLETNWFNWLKFVNGL